ncbi:KGGVGR-motif variant AAA ATPase [Streptomyces sp. NPDC088387]|uniref:nSTAND1 domain-containing NTPase n=1 Tax=Streptomyces sp. NPDC088387 TaxID=3365859 RepID=UPI0038119905
MIVTFYSYKGGVGRSMALANIADQLARSGMRVLMVDFDLEAPGLEHFFPIDHERIRGREGMLDLLLAFKYAMSVAASETAGPEDDAFRDLDRYLATVYPRRSDGGCLDLLPAGLRLTDEQISHYGAELRRFDWQDFYFVWSGELFFEWFRRTCAARYDIVLVDSRTGVTELGGVCAYQLADTIVTLCAPNLQNVEGTAWMVRHFLSPEVRSVRGDRPLDVLVVPARVDQNNTELLDAFADRFRHTFDPYVPPSLTRAGLAFWELQIPYESAYAFEEQVVTDPRRVEERRGLARAYGSLRDAITLLAPDDSPLTALRPTTTEDGLPGSRTEPLETRYDPTTRFAAPDVFLSYDLDDRETAETIRELLAREGLSSVPEPRTGQPWQVGVRAKVGLVLVSPPGELGHYQSQEVLALANREDSFLLPVLMPGVQRAPDLLRNYQFLDFREGFNAPRLLEVVRAGLRSLEPPPLVPVPPARSPYPGLAPFSEAEADVFFGRDELVDLVLATLDQHRMCTITGGAGSGKTSLVNAGVLPALRAEGLPGSHLWPITVGRGAKGLLKKLRSLPDRGTADHTVVVIDQFEELLTSLKADERERIIVALRRVAEDPAILPVIVVRTDYLVATHMHAPFLAEHTVRVPPLTGSELRQAVEMPARTRGLEVEPGLTDRLVQDMARAPGSLPLLQSTLRTLWQAREDGYLTHQEYGQLGGISGQLTRAAEELFESFSTEDKALTHSLFLHLVSVDSDGLPVGRAVSKESLEVIGVTDVCERMVQHRVLTIASTAHDEPCVLLAHNALVEAWPRLRNWISESSSALQLHRQLSVAAEEWERSGRATAGLLGEQSLSAVTTAVSTTPITFAPHESAYLDASQADAKARRQLRNRFFAVLSAALGAGVVAVVAAFSLNSDTWTVPQAISAALGACGLLVTGGTTLLTREQERRSLTL